MIQNSLNHYGNAVVGWEPRFGRCHCSSFWPRTRHSIVRNFVYLRRAEQALRPQIMPYAAAFGGGATVATWLPGANVVVKGYQAAITQVAVGIGANWLAEFAPEITHAFHLKRSAELTDISRMQRGLPCSFTGQAFEVNQCAGRDANRACARSRRLFRDQPSRPYKEGQYFSGTNSLPFKVAWSSYLPLSDRLGSFTFSRRSFL